MVELVSCVCAVVSRSRCAVMVSRFGLFIFVWFVSCILVFWWRIWWGCWELSGGCTIWLLNRCSCSMRVVLLCFGLSDV